MKHNIVTYHDTIGLGISLRMLIGVCLVLNHESMDWKQDRFFCYNVRGLGGW